PAPRGDPLPRARPDSPDREPTGQVGLKHVEGRGGIRAAVLSGQDEAAVVQTHRVPEPPGTGFRADHDEDSANRPFHRAPFCVADLDAAKTLVARELDHL